ncbi:enoyl-ACP reductase FabI [soil metagenome]
MTQLLDGKTFLVTGLSSPRGIGQATAKALHEHGAKLILSSTERSAGKVATFAETIGAQTIVCDGTNEADLELFPSKVGKLLGADQLNGFVHCMAGADPADLRGELMATLSLESFAATMNVSVFSFLKMTELLRPLMGMGSSVITFSYLASTRAVPFYNVMGIAKAALEASVRALALELGPQAIRVNGISAPPLPTVSARVISGSAEMISLHRASTLVNYPITAADVANVALYLASDLSRSTTGEILMADGGFSHAVAPRQN